MMNRRKVCVVLTARASYSRFKTALEAIRDHEQLELQLVLAASTLLRRYGSASGVIEADGFHITARVHNVVESDGLSGQAKTTGLGIIELSSIFDSLQPDMVVTVADRYETMATALAAAYLNIPLVHIQGGEVTGNIDEKVRHAITKLADLHLVSTERAAERVIKLGEQENKVFVTGCPSIDLAKRVEGSARLLFDPYKTYRGVGAMPDYSQGYLVVMQHPVTDAFREARMQIEETLLAVESLGLPTFWFWPNIDGGSDGISNGIRAFRERHNPEKIHFFKNMEPEDFLVLLKNCRCLAGNSSVGIRECSYLGVPVVNIGGRQDGRQRGRNVLDVGYDRKSIEAAINKQMVHGTYDKDPVYGNGHAGVKIADLIFNSKITFTKKLTY